MGRLDEATKISVVNSGQTFRDCRTGKLYKMKRINGAMVILETSDEEDDRKEIGIFPSIVSASHYRLSL